MLGRGRGLILGPLSSGRVQEVSCGDNTGHLSQRPSPFTIKVPLTLSDLASDPHPEKPACPAWGRPRPRGPTQIRVPTWDDLFQVGVRMCLSQRVDWGSAPSGP